MADFYDKVFRLSASIVTLGFVFSLVIGLPVLLIVRMRWEKTVDAYRPLFRGLRMTERAEPGMVRVEFTVYQGLLLWFTQMTFKLFGPPEDAKVFLSRCLSFSLRRGLLAHAGILMPFVLFPTYWFQKRSIRQQMAKLTDDELQLWPPLHEFESEESPDEDATGVMPWGAVLAICLLILMAISTLAYAASAWALNDTSDIGQYLVFGGIGSLVWATLSQQLATK